MRKLIYSMGVSLDGFIAAPGGAIDWTAPDEELHRFHNERARETGVQLLGRRLYETMLVWDTAEEQPSFTGAMLEFAPIWKATPKLVFSTTLDEVQGANTALATRTPQEEVARLKAEPGDDIAVGGAGLAATLIEAGLVDEHRLFVYPVILGAGTPFFPPLGDRIQLELVETRTFGSRVVYVRYRRVA
jgi:dihydrofolate reductase